MKIFAVNVNGVYSTTRPRECKSRSISGGRRVSYCARGRSWFLAFFSLLLVSGFISFSSPAQDAPAYKNPKLSVDQRVADLLSRMTLEEKIAQIDSAWGNAGFVIPSQPYFVDKQGVFL